MLLKERGISKYDLRKFGISPTIIKRLVDNEYVNVSTIEQMCEILNCQPGDIMVYERPVSNILNSFDLLCKEHPRLDERLEAAEDSRQREHKSCGASWYKDFFRNEGITNLPFDLSKFARFRLYYKMKDNRGEKVIHAQFYEVISPDGNIVILGVRKPAVFEAERFIEKHYEARPVTEVREISRDVAEKIYHVSETILKRGNNSFPPVFGVGKFEMLMIED